MQPSSTIVFVHGVPESSAVWTALFAALADRGITDVAALSPPGFGAPVADDFGATRDDYVAWLIDQLSTFDQPVHLVGHDWGTGHVMGVVDARPDLVRSYAVDVAGLFHHDYVWHDAAQSWRTPDVGEAALAAMASLSTDDLAGVYQSFGLDADSAHAMASAMGPDMVRCILALYRSADEATLAALGDRLADSTVPGLTINATADPYVNAGLTAAMTHRWNAQTLTLNNSGHWWMASSSNGAGPVEAADGLVRFWDSL